MHKAYEKSVPRHSTDESSLEKKIHELTQERELVKKALREGKAPSKSLEKINEALVSAFLRLQRMNLNSDIVKRTHRTLKGNHK
jgi:hypothetical protein